MNIVTKLSAIATMSTAILLVTGGNAAPLVLKFEPSDTAPFMHIDELRGGFMVNDFVNNHPDEEDGFNITGQVFLGEPDFGISNEWLDFVLTPRPFVGASLNTESDTSFVSAGLSWDLYITEDIFIEGGVGAALHNGPLTPSGGNIGYGCRANFYEYGAIGYDVGENWRVLLTVDHFSSANVCKPNSGNSTLGLQVGYKF